MTQYTQNIFAPGEGQRRLFLKAGCPFCTKLVVFLSAAGLQETVKPIYDCPTVRTYIAAVNGGRCTFPAIELEPDVSVMLETDDIIAMLMQEHNIDASTLWASRYFEQGMLITFRALFRYLIESEGGYENAKAWFEANAQMVRNPCPPEGAAKIV